MRSRVLVGAAGAVLIAATAVVAISTLFAVKHGGPLDSTNPTNVEAGLDADEVATWGEILPTNSTSRPIRITEIDPVNAVGVDVLQLVVNRPDVDGSIGFIRDRPPATMATSSAAGALLAPAGAPDSRLEVLLVLRLTGEVGTIDGLRIRYELDGTRYEAVLPRSLRLFAEAKADHQ